MKACPHCQSTYEDWIEFCFNDGVPLVAYEPKLAPAQKVAPKPAPPPASVLDAPEARFVAGADLPEPANLGRFGAARSAYDAPTPSRGPAADAPTRAPLSPPGGSPSALPNDAPNVSPPSASPQSPAASAPQGVAAAAPPVTEPEVLASPTPIAAPLPAAEAKGAPLADEDDEETSIPEPPRPASDTLVPDPPAALPAPVVTPPVVTAPVVAPVEDAAPVVPPVAAPAPRPADVDVDAFADLASALKEPSAASAAATVPFLPPLREESEDARATVPMYTPPTSTPYGEKSALDDDEPARKKAAGAGIGIALIGLIGLGALAVVAAGGVWWMSSGKDEDAVVVAPKPTTPAVLPAAAPPPAPASVAVEPVEDPALAAVPAAAPVAAPAAAPATTSAPPPQTVAAAKPPSATTGSAASTPRSTPTTPTSQPTSRPPATTPAPTVADASAPSTTSDSVWGTPAAPTAGNLRIVTDPDGATVYVNDVAKGKTPVTIELPYGAHQIKVARAGYKTEIRDVNIRVRELTVPFNLKPEVVTGQVNVYGPDGFRVVVDGHDMGPMPVTVQVSEGVRQFKLVGSDGSSCNLPKEIKFKAAGRPETITLACP